MQIQQTMQSVLNSAVSLPGTSAELARSARDTRELARTSRPLATEVPRELVIRLRQLVPSMPPLPTTEEGICGEDELVPERLADLQVLYDDTCICEGALAATIQILDATDYQRIAAYLRPQWSEFADELEQAHAAALAGIRQRRENVTSFLQALEDCMDAIVAASMPKDLETIPYVEVRRRLGLQ